LTQGQRKQIEQAFQGRLLNVYGHTEGCAVGIPCLSSDHLHFLPQVGLIELVDEQGKVLTEPGSRGELVVTGFNNTAFPMIRYRTGDVGVLGEQDCQCGRNFFILKEIEGRLQDFVVDKHKNLIPLAPAVFNYNDMDWRGIREFKVVQNEIGTLEFLVQLENATTADKIQYVAMHVNDIFGGSFVVNVKQVEGFERSRVGKHRYLDQRLNIDQFS
jgi:phenylacetate-CoA ligase